MNKLVNKFQKRGFQGYTDKELHGEKNWNLEQIKAEKTGIF